MPYTSPVGSFAPNGYGLFDMVGNIQEWCWDWSGSYYQNSPYFDPKGLDSGSFRIARGGSWGYHAGYSRVVDRNVAKGPIAGYNYIGFRVARSAAGE